MSGVYAYALLGAIYVDPLLARRLFVKLQRYFQNPSPDWPWPEEAMTYANGILPYAFLRYGIMMKNEASAKLGYKLLEFVHGKCVENRVLGPIGNDGWLPKDGSVIPDYSQQPIDSAYMTMAWIAASQYFNSKKCIEHARHWDNWFEGKNIIGKKMYNPADLECYDGIDKGGVHKHSGAESNICLLLSKFVLQTKYSI
jgi:hypothetical protein